MVIGGTAVSGTEFSDSESAPQVKSKGAVQ